MRPPTRPARGTGGSARARRSPREFVLRRTLLFLVVIAAFAAPRAATAAIGLRGYVVANGGISNPPSTAPGLRCYGTVGQAVIGLSTGVGNRLSHGFWSFGGSRVLAVDPPVGPALPREVSVGLAYPNPSRDQVRFAVALPAAARVRFEVFDVAGRRVGDPIEREFEAGYRSFAWNAPGGRSGLFFARLYVAGRLMGERRIVLME